MMTSNGFAPATKRRESSARGSLVCPLAHSCGGCQLQGMSYQEQLEWKQDYVDEVLGRFSVVAPILGMQRPVRYRNKIQAVFGRDRSGAIVSGIYRAGTHRIIPVRDCMIEDEISDKIIGTVRSLMKTFRIDPYDEDAQSGCIRHVLVKRGFSSGQVMVVLVVGTPRIPSKADFINILRQRHPEITTILMNLNDQHTSMVLGDGPETVLYGPGYIEDALCGLRFRISAKSFYQVNPVQTEKLYDIAMKMARLSGTESVIDAYCGTGTIGLVAARRGAAHVTGIELNPDAVRDAVANADRNGITNVEFVCADASAYLKELATEKRHVDVVFLDPPRAGSDERFLSSMIRLAPDTVVYISCNPLTLERDLRYLLRFGSYEVRGIQPVDMFPYTDHVETVVLMSRVDGK
ncbi:MAG: 23S rRNA (uracil(1939)-C(5))-methyltransferase RlmD [Sphaerochaetaceae bacterium]